ncbi:unnamed protein product [Zymoseptoria tritici ST99CH_1A5]|uniref:Uncharacterized protein n=2 Tax=Zymoseptoria tritici TaxID=1047171 RepID=A0A2H1FWN7_ZYMTR|nr:unnamed protein product [Zymoseptoria tritici ST99CH_1E4]SMY20878.1 unnamed protein product [Zymoseptoria tritici ST99CH_1A5]
MARYEEYEAEYDRRSGKLRTLIDKVSKTLRPPRKTTKGTKRAGDRLEHDVSKRHRTSEAAQSTEVRRPHHNASRSSYQDTQFSPISTGSFDFPGFESQPSLKSTGSSNPSNRDQRASSSQQLSPYSESTQPSSPQRLRSHQGPISRAAPPTQQPSRQGASARVAPPNQQPSRQGLSSQAAPPTQQPCRQDASARVLPSPPSDLSHTQVAPLDNQPSGFTAPIVGRYYNKDGVQVEVSSANLPRSVLANVYRLIRALDVANPDWKAMSFTDRCVVKRIITKQTNFKWSKDDEHGHHHEACQTCTNSCSLCLR